MPFHQFIVRFGSDMDCGVPLRYSIWSRGAMEFGLCSGVALTCMMLSFSSFCHHVQIFCLLMSRVPLGSLAHWKSFSLAVSFNERLFGINDLFLFILEDFWQRWTLDEESKWLDWVYSTQPNSELKTQVEPTQELLDFWQNSYFEQEIHKRLWYFCWMLHFDQLWGCCWNWWVIAYYR